MPCRQLHNLKVRNSTTTQKSEYGKNNLISKKELKKLPGLPRDVYIMHDKDDVIIYIGKAKRPDEESTSVLSGEPQ